MVTQKEIRAVFDYNPNTGECFRKVHLNKNHLKGELLGTKTYGKNDYPTLQVNKVSYKLHRLIWLHIYGYFPEQIDHKNRNKLDNRLSNLRESNYSINNKNLSKRVDNTSGVTGVHKHYGKWRARIKVNKKMIYLGVYESKQDAILVRKKAMKKYNFTPSHGE